MKFVPATLVFTTSVLSTSVCAFQFDGNKYCQTQSQLAMSAMEFRQAGMPKEEAMARLGATNVIVIETAYASPVTKDKKQKSEYIYSMGSAFHAGCVAYMKSQAKK
ncbi:hypothetical protein MW329_001893 [Vibrio vulnificus]|nr:hypothetical protein [Vibrio vulnificus]